MRFGTSGEYARCIRSVETGFCCEPLTIAREAQTCGIEEVTLASLSTSTLALSCLLLTTYIGLLNVAECPFGTTQSVVVGKRQAIVPQTPVFEAHVVLPRRHGHQAGEALSKPISKCEIFVADGRRSSSLSAKSCRIAVLIYMD